MRQLLVALLACAAVSPARAQSIRINESVAELEARVQRDSLDPAAHYNVAIGYLSRNRYDQADSALQRAVELDPQFAVAYFALGLVQNRNERYWDRLRRDGGDSAVVREVRRRVGLERKAFLIDPFVDVRLLGSVWRRGWVSVGVTSAVERLAEGDYRRAYEEFDRLLQYNVGSGGLDSIYPGFLWMHAVAAAQTQHYPEAIADVEALLRRSLASEGNDSSHVTPLRTNEYRYMLAALNQRAGNRPEAGRLYMQVIENDIGNYMAQVQLARLYEGDRSWERAIAARRAAADANPEDHTLVYDVGATMARAGRWPDAEEALRRAAEMQPRYTRTWYTLGVVQQQQGKHVEARESFNKFIATAPSRFSTQVNDARTRLGQLP